MSHVSAYHLAMAKIVDDPLALTDADYAVLEDFGGPQDVTRGRLAVAKRQGALVKTDAGTPSAAPVTRAQLRTALDATTEGLATATFAFIKTHIASRRSRPGARSRK